MAGAAGIWEQGILSFTVTGGFNTNDSYAGLLTAVGDDSGGGTITEVSGGGYARIHINSLFGAPAGSGPATNPNTSAITWAAPTSPNWGEILAVGIWDAATAGSLIAYDYLGNYLWQPCTISAAAPAVFTAPAHGFNVGDTVVYLLKYGGVQPTFSQSNLTGLLSVAHASGNSFDVTNAATPVNTSALGSGMVRKVVPIIVNAGDPALSLAIGAMVLTQA